MGLLDKIKNALFEVEYVEVDDAPKQKKVKEKREKEEKPIAKKIVLPGKKEEKLEELHEEELKDEDFEIRPKDEKVKEKPRDEFKIMDDNDFKVDDDISVETPEILQVLEENEEVSDKIGKHAGIVEEEFVPVEKEENQVEKIEQLEDYYQSNNSVSTTRESKPYGLDNSYNVPVHPYGGYERKEEKTYFRPSPIISPIYGILDKNYKKEDVKEKKEVRLSSAGYGRNLSVDDIRNKAYGEKKEINEKKEEVSEKEESTKFEVEEEEDNLLVDLSDRSKPEVKELTMGDAMEYFQDLGLEYNVDYVDVSKEKATPKKAKVEEDSKKEETDNVLADDIEEATSKIPVKETKEALNKADNVEDDNDNLFDLIDSMYQDKD